MSAPTIDTVSEELVITFAEETPEHEHGCQSIAACSRVALWRVWFSKGCKCRGKFIDYCTDCKDAVLSIAVFDAYQRLGALCPLCLKGIGKITRIEPIR